MTMRASVVLSLLASASLVAGCASDDSAVSALTNATLAAETAPEVAAPATVDNFMLADQDLMGHELYRLADAKAVVLISYGVGCPIARSLVPHIKALRDAYKAQGVEVLLVDSNLQDSPEAIKKETEEFGLDIPVLIDANQLVGEQLGVTRTGEFFVIDPKTWKVTYRGLLDDRFDYGVQKAVANHNWTRDAIDATLAGRPAMAANKPSPGCLVDFPERAKRAQHAKISYSKDIAPILEAKCVSCHQAGSIGPFAMTSYDMVKGFSPMIREAVRTDRMPPWNADPHVGKFKDDKSLTKAEIKTLVHWIEAGSPRGEGPDPLAAKQRVAAEWPLGRPDLILDIPTYKIPASGVVDYQRPWVANPLTEGKWIKASTYKIGSRQGVHHYLSGYVQQKDLPAPGQPINEMRWGAGVGGYAVGADSTFWPKNVGTYLPPGGGVAFQAHYTPYGKEEVEKSQIGIYFYKDNELPDLMMRSTVVVDNTITIPAGEGRHRETAYVYFPKEALLYSAFPHAHYRGYASDLWLETPDGKKSRLLAMPRYDFNWQREYAFAEPVKIPAGSRVIANYWYDNSKRNPANPDPTKEIVWGDQSFEEMFYTALRYRWIDETAKKQVNYDEILNQTRMLGMMDDNIDGAIQKAELKGEMGNRLIPFFAQIDANKSGALEPEEMKAVGEYFRRRQASTPAPVQAATPAAAPAAAGGGGGKR